MILHEFPDLQWLKQQADQRFVNRKAWGGGVLPKDGWPTVILNTKTQKTYRDNIRGPFSLFTNLSGVSHVSVEGKSVKVKDDLIFVTNADQHYTLQVEEKRPIETFNIHFGEYFADQVFESISSRPEKLLDDTFQVPHLALVFHNRLQPKNDVVKKLILELKEKSVHDALYQEEKLIELLSNLMHQENKIHQVKEQLPALKLSTRDEVLQRLLRSTDYIYSYYHQSLSLDELAQAACLSKFHFLRLFKLAFQKTPHQFITDVRLQKAKELLRQTKLSIHEVSMDIGFDNSSSFSRLFYNSVGVYPTQYQTIIS